MMKNPEEGEFAELVNELRADPVPEPSPLFWDHFSARVSQAIRRETAEAPAPGWSRKPWTVWAAAAVAVLVLVVALWRATLVAPNPGDLPPSRAAQGSAVPSTDAPVTSDDVETDAAWAVVRAAADGMGWEEAQAAGITAMPGAVEGMALELSAEERTELARLLELELQQAGIS